MGLWQVSGDVLGKNDARRIGSGTDCSNVDFVREEATTCVETMHSERFPLCSGVHADAGQSGRVDDSSNADRAAGHARESSDSVHGHPVGTFCSTTVGTKE